MEVSVEREHQRDRVLSDGVRRIGRDPHDGQAELVRRGEIDVVETGASQSEQTRAAGRERGQGRLVKLIGDECADRREARGHPHALLVKALLEIDQFLAKRFIGRLEEIRSKSWVLKIATFMAAPQTTLPIRTCAFLTFQICTRRRR
jgi:hypothetical protein